MKKILFIIMCCVISLSAKTTLDSFRDDIQEILDAKKVYKVDSVNRLELFNKTKLWQEDNLENLKKFVALAKSEYEKVFMEKYLLMQQIVILDFATQKVIKNSDRDDRFLKSIFEEQMSWFLSFVDSGVNPFEVLLQAPMHIGTQCEHVNEVFIISNMLQNSKHAKELSKAAQYPLDLYNRYVALTMVNGWNVLEILRFDKHIEIEKLSESEIKEIERIIEIYNKNSQIYSKFSDYFIAMYLDGLYAGKMILQVISENLDMEGISPTLQKNHSLCLITDVLDEKSLKYCKSIVGKMFGKISPDSKPPNLIVFSNNRFCVDAGYKNDTFELHATKKPDKFCKAVIHYLNKTYN